MAQMNEIELALSVPVGYIVRGEAAKDNSAVRWYRWKKLFTNLASALTGIGLASPILSAVQDKEVSLIQIWKDFVGLPLVLLIIGIAGFAIARKLYESADVEKKAILSLALSESFKRVRKDLERKLPYPDPRTQLESVVQVVNALDQYTEPDLMPNAADCQDAIDVAMKDLVKRFSGHWVLTKGQMERR